MARKGDKSHLHVVGEDPGDPKKKARKKRDYENEIPDVIDLDKDYSVLLAQADQARAEAAIVVQRYHVMKETEERVASINEIFRRHSCVPG